MDAKTTDLLLTDAREQYTAELDRAGQVYTRCGLYLAVMAIYVGALARFLDKPPTHEPKAVFIVFLVGSAILALSIVTTLALSVSAIWGREVSYTLLPDDWLRYVSELEPWLAKARETGVTHDLEADVKERMIARLAKATSQNFETRVIRFGFCHHATKALAIGFIGLIGSVGSYAFVVVTAPTSAPTTRVSIVDPVPLKCYDLAMAGTGASSSPAAAPAPAAPAPTAHPATTTRAPAALGPKPEPRDVRNVKDGEVRRARLRD